MTPSPSTSRPLAHIRRVVVKIGSAVLAPSGTLNVGRVASLAADIVSVRERSIEIVLVSSGAVASGYRDLGLARPPRTIIQKQAAAALGQQRLMRAYGDAFSKHRVLPAQVLLTSDDIENRQRALNARHTLAELLRRGCLPIVNENDSVSYDEIRFGDNDHLSALVAHLVDADLLVMLSQADGLRESAGRGPVIDIVTDIDDAQRHVDTSTSDVGVGGMASKIDAVRLAGIFGIPSVIAPGGVKGVVGRVLAGATLGTLFTVATDRFRRPSPWHDHYRRRRPPCARRTRCQPSPVRRCRR